jgi:hypothetical protein
MIYLSQLAGAIVEVLRTLEGGASAIIARRREVSVSLESLTGTLVTVVPWGVVRSQTAEGIHEVTQEVRIVVQRKLAAGVGCGDSPEANAAANLVEEIAAQLVGRTLFGAECSSANGSPSYSPDKMAELGMFDSTIVSQWKRFEDGPDA